LIRGNTRNSNQYTKKGWMICISWKDGTSSWHPMSEIKNSYPLQLAEYDFTNDLQDEPSFKWWVKPTLKQRRLYIKAAKRRILKKTHKFGIKIPQTVEEAIQIDRSTKTTFWHDAIHKEMKNNRLAFRFLEEDERVPVGFKWIRCHMIFDVKMDFTWKAHFVAGGTHNGSSRHYNICKHCIKG
jgi:hypothetical protein